jgi:hypothetical protein
MLGIAVVFFRYKLPSSSPNTGKDDDEALLKHNGNDYGNDE